MGLAKQIGWAGGGKQKQENARWARGREGVKQNFFVGKSTNTQRLVHNFKNAHLLFFNTFDAEGLNDERAGWRRFI